MFVKHISFEACSVQILQLLHAFVSVLFVSACACIHSLVSIAHKLSETLIKSIVTQNGCITL